MNKQVTPALVGDFISLKYHSEYEIHSQLNTTLMIYPFNSAPLPTLVEVGGLVQNGGVVAREYGKLCVVGIQGITTTLQGGQLVEVDGTTSVVRILDELLAVMPNKGGRNEPKLFGCNARIWKSTLPAKYLRVYRDAQFIAIP